MATNHWHRASTNPDIHSADEMRDDLNIETSNLTFESADEAMDIVGIMKQWIGESTDRWSGWSIKSSTVRPGAVKIYERNADAFGPRSVIYFPWQCSGQCPSERN